MDDILTFVSQRIKLFDKLTMKDMPELCNLSKSKFYRCMAEPVRFTDEQLGIIADVLNLDEAERSRLFSFKYTTQQQEKSRVNDLIHKILFGRLALKEDISSPIFTIYRTVDAQPEIIRCSAADLAGRLRAHLISDPSCTDGLDPQFNITLFNTHAPRKVQAVYSLLKCLYDIDHLGEIYSVSIRHLVNVEEAAPLADRLEIFANIFQLSAFGSYFVQFKDLRACPWETTDCCIIDYTCNTSGEKRYLFALIPSDTDVILYSFTQKIHFDFLTHNAFRYANIDTQEQQMANNPILISQYFIDAVSKHKKLLVDFEPCFENLMVELWQEKKQELLNSEEKRRSVMDATDPKRLLREYDAAEYIDILFHYCIKRVESTEKAESTNLISATGLREFAQNGYTTETLQTGIQLSPSQVVRQLAYMNKQLGKCAKPGQQVYYLIDPLCSFSKIAFQIFRGYQVGTFMSGSPMLELSWKVLPDADMATAFYDYVTTELLPANKRNEPGSPIMSDEKAQQYIDRLIAEIENRQAAKQDEQIREYANRLASKIKEYQDNAASAAV